MPPCGFWNKDCHFCNYRTRHSLRMGVDRTEFFQSQVQLIDTLEISSLSHSVVFLYFFALVVEQGFLLSLLAILWNSAFRCLYLSFFPLLFASFLSTAICKASPDSYNNSNNTKFYIMLSEKVRCNDAFCLFIIFNIHKR